MEHRIGDNLHSDERLLLARFAAIGLAVTLAIAAVLGYWLQRMLVEDALDAAASMAAAQAGTRLRPELTVEDMARPFGSTLSERIDGIIRDELAESGIVRVKIWNTGGVVVYSDEPDAVGMSDPQNAELAGALAGRVEAHLTDLEKRENAAERGWGRLLEVYVPLRAADSSAVAGAYELYRTTEGVDARISQIRAMVAAGVFGGFITLFLALFGVMRSAARRLVERAAENRRLAADLVSAYDHTIEGWARALDLKDHETEGHSRRVTELTLEAAREAGIDGERLAHVRRGALLHDIGKMGVPDRILNKPGPLDEQEWAVMRRHTEYAREMLGGIPYLVEALPIPVYHHERWDGSGYPEGLSGEAIALEARLFAVIDVYDALTNDRPYRPAWSHERAVEHIRAGAGSHFDPDAVDVVLRVIERARVQKRL